MAAIVFNTVILSIEDPTRLNSTRSRAMYYGDIVCSIIYLIEMLLKITVFGLDGYLSNGWNILDCLIATTGMLALLPLFNTFHLEPFKLLRPIKLAHAIPQMNLLFRSLGRSIPLLMNVFILYFFFILAMGVIAVQQWEGLLLNRCVPWDGNTTATVTVTQPVMDTDYQNTPICRPLSSFTSLGGRYCPWGTTCVPVGNPQRGWVSFDHIGFAMLTLFASISLEGWSEVMYHTMDATTPAASIFWLLLILFGTYFLMNLTLLIITETFSTTVAKHSKEGRRIRREFMKHLMRTRIMMWLEGVRLSLVASTAAFGAKTRPQIMRDRVAKVLRNKHFKRLVISAIVANTVLLAAEYHGQPQSETDAINTVNIILTVFFTIEVLLKLFTGMRRFFKDTFNKLDLLIVVAGLLELVVSGNGSVSALRSLRVLRVLKLMTYSAQLQKWFDVLVTATKSVMYLAGILLLLLLTGSLWGMRLFGGKFCESNPGPDGCTSVPRTNYDSLHNGIIATFQIVTGEDWNIVMYNGMSAVGWYSVFFFIAVFFVGHYLVLNLFVAVLLSSCNTCTTRALHPTGYDDLTTDQIDEISDISEETLHLLLLQKGVTRSVISQLVEMDGLRFASSTESTYDGFEIKERYWRLKLLRVAEMLRSDIDGFKKPNEHVRQMTSFMRDFFYKHSIPFPKEEFEVVVASYADDPRLFESCMLLKYPEHHTEIYGMFAAWVAADDMARRDRRCITSRLREIFLSHDSKLCDVDQITSFVHSYEDSPSLLGQTVQDTLQLEDREILFIEDWCDDKAAKETEYSEFYDTLERQAKNKRAWWYNWAPVVTDRSLFYFEREHPARDVLFMVVESTAFELLVLAAIFTSTVALAIDTPLRPEDHPTEVKLRAVNFYLTFVFLTECVLKSVAYGFVLHEDSYLRREVWNRLDFFIVCTSLAKEIIPGAQHFGMFKILRTLRPLRFINKVQGVKVVFTAMLLSFPPLVNVTLISLSIWLVFAIIALQLFSGKFHRCSLDTYGDTPQFFTRDACLNATAPLGGEYKWMNSMANFDNIGNSFLTLFQVASLEGWVGVMHDSIDAVSYEHAPVQGNSPWVAYFFVLFIVFGSFLILNLFIGVLIDTYSTQKQKVGASLFLSPGQDRWVRAHMEMLQMVTDGISEEVPFGYSAWRTKLFMFVTDSRFDIAISFCIAVNVIGMASEHHPSSETFDSLIARLNECMLGVFAVEVVLKILAFGPARYLRNPWCRFDLGVVVVSMIPLLLLFFFHLLGKDHSGEADVITQFRALRLIRLLRMMRSSRGIRRMLTTFLFSIPSLVNVSCVLFLLFFVYSILGVWLLGKATWINGLNRHANFTHFGPALLLLFRLSTGEAWQQIMYDCMADEDEGCDDHLGGCIPRWWAPIYFCSFTLVGMYVLSNLFVAVVLDNFGTGVRCLDEPYRVVLRRQWEKHGTGQKLPFSNLEKFLKGIGPPLGLYPDSKIVSEFIASLDLRVHGEPPVIYRSELFPKLFHQAFGAALPQKHEEKLHKQQQILLADISIEQEEMMPLTEVMKIIKIQSTIRGFLTRLKLRTAKGNPANWLEYRSDDTDQTYYYNTQTGETTWVKPVIGLQCDFSKIKRASKRSTLPTVPPVPTAQKWVEFTTSEGFPYYCDAATGRSSWEKPVMYCREV